MKNKPEIAEPLFCWICGKKFAGNKTTEIEVDWGRTVLVHETCPQGAGYADPYDDDLMVSGYRPYGD